MTQPPRIAVIIPTLGTERRAPMLWRAIDGVLGQARVRALPIVVANGPGASGAVLDALQRRSDLRLARLPDADMPGALRRGRELVDTEHFSELDDDDELLPDALCLRLAVMEQDPRADVVVGNGIMRSRCGDHHHIPDVARVRDDPLRAMLARNWLAPGSALFRADRVTRDFFDGIPRYLEWTALGIRLALDRRVVFLDAPGFVHHTDHEFSVTNSEECTLGLPAAVRSLLDLPMPEDVRSGFRQKLAPALHGASTCALAHGRLCEAWGLHGRSLFHPGGMKYWTFTGRLLLHGLLGSSGRGPGAVERGPAADSRTR